MIRGLLRLFSGLAHETCAHDWEITFVDRVTMAPQERKCRKCDTMQRAEVIWVPVSSDTQKENRLV